MPEELTLHQSLGDRRAVKGDEWAIPAWAIAMNRAGDELLARSALAHDTDVGVAPGHLVDLGEDLSELLRVSDDARLQAG